MHAKRKVLAVALVIGVVFIAGVAVGKNARQAQFVGRDEVKWIDLRGLKLGVLTGNKDTGPYTALFTMPAGFESPWHSHTGDYEAVQLAGTSRHWMRAEDGAKAKKMTPGSYWTIPGGLDHISACDAGAECVLVIWQKTKFDSHPGKDVKAVAPPAKKP